MKDIMYENNLSEQLQERLKDVIVICIGDSKIYVNGKKDNLNSNLNIVPLLKSGRTLVPASFIANFMAPDVKLIKEEQTLLIQYKEKNIKMVVGYKKIHINENEIETDIPAEIINNEIFVPIRVITENLDKNIFWDSRGIVIISNEEEIFDEQQDKNLLDELADDFEVRVTSKQIKEKLNSILQVPKDGVFKSINLENINNKKYYIYEGYIEKKVEENGESKVERGNSFGIYYVDRSNGCIYEIDNEQEGKLILIG